MKRHAARAEWDVGADVHARSGYNVRNERGAAPDPSESEIPLAPARPCVYNVET